MLSNNMGLSENTMQKVTRVIKKHHHYSTVLSGKLLSDEYELVCTVLRMIASYCSIKCY
jgi:hypothetical protein